MRDVVRPFGGEVPRRLHIRVCRTPGATQRQGGINESDRLRLLSPSATPPLPAVSASTPRAAIGHAVLAVNLDDHISILNNQTGIIAPPSRYENFILHYLVNETTLWTAAPNTLDALVSRIAPARLATGSRG